MMYSSSIFKDNHASEVTALIGTILIGATTVDGVYSYSLIVEGIPSLVTPSVFGRKKIMIYGTLALSLALSVLAIFDMNRLVIVF